MELVIAAACVLFSASGGRVDLNDMVMDLARRDVVFFGEEHDNGAGHRHQLEALEALHAQRPDLVLSMEMFERDVQGVLDDYLRGRIDEAKFLEHARPWSNYKEHYRPLVEFAKKNGLDVLAANAPRQSARGVALAETEGSPWVARVSDAPKDRYYALFGKAMKDHVGADNTKAIDRMYAAQCLKDDTMAESISTYLAGHPHRRPLVVHVCGKFHSDYGLGTVGRLLHRRPLTQVGVVTMVASADGEKTKVSEHLEKAHFVMIVAPEAKKEAESAPKEPKKTEKPTPNPNARAGLGIMPDYGSTGGLKVDVVRDGGPAAAGGMKDKDVIISLDKSKIQDLDDYMDVLGDLRPGQTVEIVVLRDGKEVKLKVTLGVSHRG